MTVTILQGDCLETLKTISDKRIQCCVTSPPYYGLRDYGVDGQIGLETTPEAYVEQLVRVFREIWRVMKDDGTLWLNLGDSYAGSSMSGGDQTTRVGGGTSKLLQQGVKIALPEGIKPKDLMGIPWMVAFALRADGWYLRQEIIWNKPNPMPESVTDRCTKSHEQIFLLSKSQRYYFDNEAIKEPASENSAARLLRGVSDHHKNIDGAPGQPPHSMNRPRPNKRNKSQSFKRESRPDKIIPGQAKNSHREDREENEYDLNTRNKRSVWTVTTKPYKGAHFATFPPDLIEPCILAGSREGDVVLDPFNGSGTTGAVALKHHRDYIGCELNPKYIELTRKRLAKVQLVFPVGEPNL